MCHARNCILGNIVVLASLGLNERGTIGERDRAEGRDGVQESYSLARYGSSRNESRMAFLHCVTQPSWEPPKSIGSRPTKPAVLPLARLDFIAVLI